MISANEARDRAYEAGVNANAHIAEAMSIISTLIKDRANKGFFDLDETLDMVVNPIEMIYIEGYLLKNGYNVIHFSRKGEKTELKIDWEIG